MGESGCECERLRADVTKLTAENEALREALAETIGNLGSLAETVLRLERRAQEHMEKANEGGD